MKQPIDIIFISKKHNFLRSIKLPGYLLTLLSLVLVGIVVFTMILVSYNTREIFIELNIARSEKEHNLLLHQLDSLNALIDFTHKQFDKSIAQDNRERTFWQMAYIHPDIWSMGVGGEKPLLDEKYLSGRVRERLNEMYEVLDVLKGKCYLRSSSLNDIEAQIKGKITLWSHKPSSHPVPGRPLGSGFGYRVDPIDKKTIRMHWGVDIGAPTGTDILATGDGVVSYTGWRKGYGLTVEIDHGFGFKTRYAHCSSIVVQKGDIVKRGQTIARVGSTGRTVAPHLHYEVHVSGVRVNPVPYIDLANVVFD